MGQLQKENWMAERKKEAKEASKALVTLPVGTDMQLYEHGYILLCTAQGFMFPSEQAARQEIARLAQHTGLPESDFDVMAMSYRVEMAHNRLHRR